MRIRELGATLHLLRYAGYDKEGKKGVESKIGAVGKNCKPIVLEKDLPSDSNEGVPLSLWRKLTVEEQEKLMEELKKRQLSVARGSVRIALEMLDDVMKMPEALTPELAENLWANMEEMQRVLKKAGFAKPPRKARNKAPADNPNQAKLV